MWEGSVNNAGTHGTLTEALIMTPLFMSILAQVGEVYLAQPVM
jgi:hypothetical protein